MAKSIANDIVTSYKGLQTLLTKIQSNLCDFLLATGGLAIGTGSKAKVKVVNSPDAWIDGKLIAITGAEVTLSGDITDGNSNVYVIVADSAGTLSAVMGTEGATKDLVVFPTISADSAVLGWVLVATVGAAFLGGTTLLDAGTVTDTYYDTPFPINPNTLSL